MKRAKRKITHRIHGTGILVGGFDFFFHPYLGKGSNLTNIFQRVGNHQQVYVYLHERIRDFCSKLVGKYTKCLQKNYGYLEDHPT